MLGAGPVGVEMAQAVRRLGGEVVVTAIGPHVLPREPAPPGGPLRREASSWGRQTVAARRDGDDFAGGDRRGRRLRRGVLLHRGRHPRRRRSGYGH
ncbi:NAD-binding protein [Streptomyces sp. NPDC086077]|uniref:NAD-binding protein n=1 Tax=Streptomyces sp. NPDC086077 TaxID=3154862 RepID=UPI003424ADE4